MFLRRLWHNLKYRFRPVEYDLDEALEEARRRHEDDLWAVDALDADQVTYLANVGDLEDPRSDGLECGN